MLVALALVVNILPAALFDTVSSCPPPHELEDAVSWITSPCCRNREDRKMILRCPMSKTDKNFLNELSACWCHGKSSTCERRSCFLQLFGFAPFRKAVFSFFIPLNRKSIPESLMALIQKIICPSPKINHIWDAAGSYFSNSDLGEVEDVTGTEPANIVSPSSFPTDRGTPGPVNHESGRRMGAGLLLSSLMSGVGSGGGGGFFSPKHAEGHLAHIFREGTNIAGNVFSGMGTLISGGHEGMGGSSQPTAAFAHMHSDY